MSNFWGYHLILDCSGCDESKMKNRADNSPPSIHKKDLMKEETHEIKYADKHKIIAKRKKYRKREVSIDQ
jgi:hypothetical protein